MAILITDVSKKDGIITQTLQTVFNGLVKEMTRWVCDTREEEIKKALIALGWTPPKKEEG